MNKILRFTLSAAVFSTLLAGCMDEKPQEVIEVKKPTIPQIAFQSEYLTDDLEETLNSLKKQVYPNMDSKNQCHIATTSEKEGEVLIRNNYCVKNASAVVTEDEKNEFLYLTLSGDAITETGEEDQGSHAAGGLVRLLKFKKENAKYILVSDSKEISIGSWGAAPTNIKTFRINSKGDIGWAITSGTTNQGNTHSSTLIYAETGEKIGVVADVPTYLDDSGNCADEDECHSNSTQLKTIPNTQGGSYFTIKATVKSNVGLKESQKEFTFDFDEKSGKYLIPAEFNKMMPEA